MWIWIRFTPPGWLSVKNPPANAGDVGVGLIPRSGRSSGGGNGNPLQYSCQENSMGRGAWQATVHGVAKSQTWLSTQALYHLPWKDSWLIITEISEHLNKCSWPLNNVGVRGAVEKPGVTFVLVTYVSRVPLPLGDSTNYRYLSWYLLNKYLLTNA